MKANFKNSWAPRTGFDPGPSAQDLQLDHSPSSDWELLFSSCPVGVKTGQHQLEISSPPVFSVLDQMWHLWSNLRKFLEHCSLRYFTNHQLQFLGDWQISSKMLKLHWYNVSMWKVLLVLLAWKIILEVFSACQQRIRVLIYTSLYMAPGHSSSS